MLYASSNQTKTGSKTNKSTSKSLINLTKLEKIKFSKIFNLLNFTNSNKKTVKKPVKKPAKKSAKK